MNSSQNYINHIALVLDASSSMGGKKAAELIKVADAQISYLAQRSKELDQETRITVYTFADTVKCVIYDKDVLRLPSIAKYYSPYGWTALIDSVLKSQDDLALTPQIYGDHAFLTYVLTDGGENRSVNGGARGAAKLADRLESLPENWTVAALVPDQISKFEAKKFGFPADNIAIWDASSAQGVSEAGETIRRATDSFMIGRASGIRGSRAIFSTGIETLNKQTVKDAKLKPIAKDTYDVFAVSAPATIRDFVEAQGVPFVKGSNYYQLNKTETIQKYKGIAVRNKKSGRFYTGPQVRDLLGLGGDDVRVKPDINPEYQVFVQSTSVNRRLEANTKLLVLK